MTKQILWGLLFLLFNLIRTSYAEPADRPTGSKSSQSKSTPGAATRSSVRSKATILLAQNGKALQPIIISAKASESTKAVAAELAGHLKRITSATFEVQTGDGSKGIVLGTLADFA